MGRVRDQVTQSIYACGFKARKWPIYAGMEEAAVKRICKTHSSSLLRHTKLECKRESGSILCSQCGDRFVTFSQLVSYVCSQLAYETIYRSWPKDHKQKLIQRPDTMRMHTCMCTVDSHVCTCRQSRRLHAQQVGSSRMLAVVQLLSEVRTMKAQLPDSNFPHTQFYSGLVNVQMGMHFISRVSAACSRPGRRREMDVVCNYSECQYSTDNKIQCNFNSKSKYKMQVGKLLAVVVLCMKSSSV